MPTASTTETIKGRVPRKGKQSGVVRKFTFIGKVKTGHEKAMREDLAAALNDPRRAAGVEVWKRVGIYSALHVPFDNDTRLKIFQKALVDPQAEQELQAPGAEIIARRGGGLNSTIPLANDGS
jgi:hypothetical protein